MRKHAVYSGVDNLSAVDEQLKGKRVGLMTNPAGVDHQLNSNIELIRQRYQLTALFAVEHGLRGVAQAGEAVGNTIDEETGVTVYSAYGANDHYCQHARAA